MINLNEWALNTFRYVILFYLKLPRNFKFYIQHVTYKLSFVIQRYIIYIQYFIPWYVYVVAMI